MLNLSPDQKAQVEVVLDKEFQARRALRADGKRPSCEQRRVVWDQSRAEMVKILEAEQLKLYDKRQQRRMASCKRAASSHKN
ncbi:hypothetical protein GP5015_1787 [gamma proteobacterium HTCC5015]|nr:hypothetical protein GP5015_1787 [gamma proteobacterium HTCC5015]